MSEKESAKAYQASLEYCEMGRERSLAKLAQKWGKSESYVGQLERWSSQYGWVERAKQYDTEQSAERNARRQKQREEMEDRHAEQSREEQDAARRYILAHINIDDHDGSVSSDEEAEKTKDSLRLLLGNEKINLSAVVQLLKNSREDERKALGVDGSQGMAVEVNADNDNVQVIVYYPQSQENEE